ncbi:MAG: tetratricopeptide repeat protein [Blastochloris sp.]|nr:tetratricopeptide repeat protein [Blastochloris sp.]
MVDAHLSLGALEEKESKWNQAVELYNQAIKLSREQNQIETAIIRFLRAHTQAGTLSKGTLEIRRLARERPDIGALGFYAIARFYFEDGNYDATLSELDNFIGTQPDSTWVPAARLLIAESFYKKKDQEAAIARLTSLIQEKKNPEVLRQARLRLAEIHYESGNFSAASEQFLALGGPDQPQLGEEAAYRGLISLAKTDQVESFEKERKLFATRYPKSSRESDLILEQASMLDRLGRGEEARKLYESLQSASSNNKAEALLRLGRSAASVNDHEKALSVLQQLEKEHPDYSHLDQAVYIRILSQIAWANSTRNSPARNTKISSPASPAPPK